MSIKVLIVFVSLAVFVQNTPSVNAICTCFVPDTIPTPRYCRSGFLAIVKITRVVIDKDQETQHNHFELLTDLTDYTRTGGFAARTSLRGFQTIDDTTDGCGHQLKANQTYLIGSQFTGEGDKRKPGLFPCSSWAEPWDYTLEKSNARLEEYSQHCAIPFSDK